ncbi:neprilysin-2 isoform X2 [Dendroctonus ponderosae]|uniref:neprilysin-2 isoform X2 n=1 Tax=Dendroctonus ponderosae TaxID=77166 RepID=UPI002035031D|nr:neprilysin-2 isoform X2 [Dendroctonus ponderosae]
MRGGGEKMPASLTSVAYVPVPRPALATQKNPTWWKRRTSMERCLTLITAIVLLIVISLVVALATVLYNRSTLVTNTPYTAEALQGQQTYVINAPDDAKEGQKMCLTPGCIHTASRVLEYMDQSVDPCDDFYQFTCGNFIKNTNIPDDKSSVTSFSIISDTLQEQLRTMIEEPLKADEPKPFQLTKKLYKACMNKTIIEADGLNTMRQILKQLGGWPALEGSRWNEGDFDWRQSVYKFRTAGYSVDYFIDFSVGIDVKNSTKRIIDLDQGSLGLRREFLTKGLNDKLVKAYYDYMVDIAVLFGADRAVASKDLAESLDFEMKLANISLPSEKRRNATALYNPMSIRELQQKFPSIPWLEYINTLLAPDTRVSNEEVIVVSIPKYISDFEALVSRTPKRAQANYVMWRAVASSVSYLSDDLRKRQLDYTTIVTGRTEREARWKECIDISAGSLSIAAGALYVRKFFNEEARQNAKEMVSDIRAEFQDILKKVDWMDDKTRQNALDKARSMSTHIAYPDEMLNDAKLEEFYEGLELDQNQYLRSILNLTLFGTRFSFKRLRQPVNKTDWITHGRPAVVNAFYSAIENSIQFPAGILQGVFFSADRPRYMNYGAIGFVIGHEITHGFDDQGRQFDKEGNLVDWWQEETKKAFVQKAQCIIDQYGNYTVPELKLNLNGINTQGENIADNGGVKEAYLAYQKWTKRNGVEPQLPGLNYTPNQMFWISASNSWCAKYRSETLRLRILTGYHSPARFRIQGPFSNSDEFARVFSCPAGSRMNPENKCRVW